MAYNLNSSINAGSFVPTTQVWDVSEIYAIKDISDGLRQLLVQLYNNLNRMSIALNTKETGYYLNEQFVIGSLYYNPNSSRIVDLRPGMHIVINTGALNAGVTTIAHTIPWVAGWQFFKIIGTATDSGTLQAVTLPYVGTTITDNISIILTATDLVITNNSGLTFDTSSVIIEFVQN